MQLKRKQTGFTMTEVILAVGISMLMMLAMAKMLSNAQKDQKAKNTAESLQGFEQIAAQYLVTNRAAIQAAADVGTAAATWCVINANATTGLGGTTANNTTKKTCAVDVDWMKYKRLLPPDYKSTNPYYQKWTAIFRLVYADYDNNAVTPNTTNGDFEILVVGAANGGKEQVASASELGLAAELAGGNGGFIPAADWGYCKYAAAKKEACGSSGGWRADLTNFIN